MTQALQGSVAVAPDKSLSHRALLFAALADGESCIQNVLTGEDVLRTLKILNQLGVRTIPTADVIFANPQMYVGRPLQMRVQGVGLHGLKATAELLYCGNSGTTMRMFLGLLSAQKFSSRLTGDASLNRRPMERVLEPLRKAGAQFVLHELGGDRVIECVGRTVANPVVAAAHISAVASAQVKSCLLLSGLYAETGTVVTEPTLSRNHTELLLQHMGVSVTTTLAPKRATIHMQPPKQLQPLQFSVPADISSAAFFLVAASLIDGSDVTLTNVNVNPTRTGILDVLQNMGAKIELQNVHDMCGEPVADLRVQAAKLSGTVIAGDVVPRLIDEIPILTLAGFLAAWRFEVRDAKELRVKETDRIQAIVVNLQKFGANITATEDGFVIEGRGVDSLSLPMPPAGTVWQTFGDHRIAMMGVIANRVLGTEFHIDDVECIQTSFPNFFAVLASLKKTPPAPSC